MKRFELVVAGVPVSQQTRRRDRYREWIETVRRTAKHSGPPSAPESLNDVRVTVAYFYEAVSLDADNIAKPVLDALKGLVFADDEQVVDLRCLVRPADSARVTNASATLQAALRSDGPFLYVLVEPSPTADIRL